jgi:O-methyltransferase domain
MARLGVFCLISLMWWLAPKRSFENPEWRTAASVSAVTSLRACPPVVTPTSIGQIIHDWERRPLRDHPAALSPSDAKPPKLLVVDYVIPAGNEPFFAKWLDLHMLVTASGRERMEAEFAKLFDAAGFTLSRVIPTPLGPSVLKAIPVPLR